MLRRDRLCGRRDPRLFLAADPLQDQLPHLAVDVVGALVEHETELDLRMLIRYRVQLLGDRPSGYRGRGQRARDHDQLVAVPLEVGQPTADLG